MLYSCREMIIMGNHPSEEQYGEQIKKIRMELNLTQKDVADALHVTPGYISNVENNRSAMSLRVLIYFARLSGMTLDELVGLIEPEYKDKSINHELTEIISTLSIEQQKKLCKTIKLWKS